MSSSRSSSRFSLASLAETFTILLNTPLVPPPEKRESMEVPMTDMPIRSYGRGLEFSNDALSAYSGSGASDNVSLRSSLDISDVDITRVFQVELPGLQIPPVSRTANSPTTSITPISPDMNHPELEDWHEALAAGPAEPDHFGDSFTTPTQSRS